MPDGLVKEPVIYTLVKRYGLTVNVFRASVTSASGWIVMSVSGAVDRIDRAVLDLRCRGAIVQEGGVELLNAKTAPIVSGVRVRLIVPRERVKEPILSEMITTHDVIINIRQARIDEEQGVLDVEITGSLSSIDTAMDTLKKRGVRVEPIEKTVIE
jgi:ABC-type methionine transport system ATPase subunit